MSMCMGALSFCLFEKQKKCSLYWKPCHINLFHIYFMHDIYNFVYSFFLAIFPSPSWATREKPFCRNSFSIFREHTQRNTIGKSVLLYIVSEQWAYLFIVLFFWLYYKEIASNYYWVALISPFINIYNIFIVYVVWECVWFDVGWQCIICASISCSRPPLYNCFEQ